MKEDVFTQIVVFGAVITPIITAFVQGIKTSVLIPNKYAPLIAVLLGLGVGALSEPFAGDIPLSWRLWAGTLAGLSSVGLFELVRKRP